MQDKKDEPKGLAIQASVSTTSCRQCIFAQYNDDNEQVNCAAGRFGAKNIAKNPLGEILGEIFHQIHRVDPVK